MWVGYTDHRGASCESIGAALTPTREHKENKLFSCSSDQEVTPYV